MSGYPSNSESVIAADRLRGLVIEIEASDDRIASENKHKSEIYKRAKDDGFNVKALRKVIAARRVDTSERAKLDNDFDLYMMHLEGLVPARVENIEENPPIAAVEKKPSRLAHNQKIAGASPAPATSVEAQQEGAADGESPSPRPVGEPGPNAGGENVATHDVDPATTAIGEDGVRADALALGSDVEAVAPAPDKQWGFKDKPHHDCLNPTQCGGFSNLGLCEPCKQAAA